MPDPLRELSDMCRQSRHASAVETIKTGELVWFRGKPAPCENGTLALHTPGDNVTIFAEQDVLKVERHGEDFFVQVSVDANVMVRIERVTKARPRSAAPPGSCKCSGDGKTTVPNRLERRQLPGSVGGPNNLSDWDWPWCRQECEFIWVDVETTESVHFKWGYLIYVCHRVCWWD